MCNDWKGRHLDHFPSIARTFFSAPLVRIGTVGAGPLDLGRRGASNGESMPNPKRKLAKSWRGCRRSHDHVHVVNLSTCPRCSQPKMAHRVCGTCGYYKGEMIVDMKKL